LKFFFIFYNFFFLVRFSSIKIIVHRLKLIKQYLNLTKLNLNIYDIFIKLLLGQVIQKKFYNLIESEKNFYEKKYKFKDNDWFSYNIPVWRWIIKRYLKKKINYLEIGTYEGRSLFYIAENFTNSDLTAVDPYLDYKDINFFKKKGNISNVYLSFKKNIKKFNIKVNFFKINSSNFFKFNKKKFDLIYIDGSHFYLDVKNDLNESLKIIKKNGIIILDDFFWNFHKKIEQNPIGGILPLIKKNKKIEIILISNQIIIRLNN